MKKIYFLLLFFVLISIETMAQITPQIVGGADTDIDEVPWQVLLEINGEDQCGGSIIAPNWILTAAHCVEGISSADITVFAGITLRSLKNNGQIRNVVEIIRHPDYGTNPDSDSDNDIALLRLSAPLNLNANVQIIDYAAQADADAGWTDPGEVATVSGWGLLNEGGNQPDHLQSIEVPVEDNATAAAQWNPEPGNWDVTNNMIPTGPFATGGSGTCRGDSGGPVVVWNNSNRPILAGIVSYGDPCATGNFLDIHTRVSRYCDWIADEIATINGPSNVCSTETYSVTNIPTDATVNWEVSPSHLVDTSSGTGIAASIEPASASTGGEATITFNISGSCGTTTTSKEIYVGKPYANLNSPPIVCTNQFSDIYTIPKSEGAETYRLVSSSPYLTIGGLNEVSFDNAPFQINFVGSQAGNYLVELFTRNDCGESRAAIYVTVERCGPGGVGSFTYYPNPASSEITIENTTYDKSETSFNLFSNETKGSIVIYDFNGSVVQTEQFNLNNQYFNLDVSKLKPGKYFMKIGAARKEEIHQIVIRR